MFPAAAGLYEAISDVSLRFLGGSAPLRLAAGCTLAMSVFTQSVALLAKPGADKTH